MCLLNNNGFSLSSFFLSLKHYFLFILSTTRPSIPFLSLAVAVEIRSFHVSSYHLGISMFLFVGLSRAKHHSFFLLLRELFYLCLAVKPKTRNQGMGMLEVPWLTVELRFMIRGFTVNLLSQFTVILSLHPISCLAVDKFPNSFLCQHTVRSPVPSSKRYLLSYLHFHFHSILSGFSLSLGNAFISLEISSQFSIFFSLFSFIFMPMALGFIMSFIWLQDFFFLACSCLLAFQGPSIIHFSFF